LLKELDRESKGLAVRKLAKESVLVASILAEGVGERKEGGGLRSKLRSRVL